MTEKVRDVNQRLAILRERRSVTSFVDQVVPKGTLLELIEYSILAPSSGNRQAWRFIIVNDNSLIKKLVDLGGSNTINKSQCGILVNYDNHALTPDYRDDFQTAAACIQNLLLAAQAYGLGACWVTILPPKTTLRKLFNIPWYYSPIAYVVVGYPDSTKPRDVPRKNNIEDIVSENTFPMQGLGRKSQARNNIKLLSAWIYRKLPITLKKRLSK